MPVQMSQTENDAIDREIQEQKERLASLEQKKMDLAVQGLRDRITKCSDLLNNFLSEEAKLKENIQLIHAEAADMEPKILSTLIEEFRGLDSLAQKARDFSKSVILFDESLF